MSHSLKKKFYAHAANLAVISLLVVGTLMPSIMKFSYAANIGVFPADSKPYGLSYGEWTARFWQWLHSIPKQDNPAADTTGKNCGLKQTGPVWFLPGTYGGTNELYMYHTCRKRYTSERNQCYVFLCRAPP